MELCKIYGTLYKTLNREVQPENQRLKAFCNEKVYGKPFEIGDTCMVWVHSPAVPRQQSRKLHHDWEGPFQALERVGSCDYRVKMQRSVNVHFDI